jgi:hypothetical protein
MTQKDKNITLKIYKNFTRICIKTGRFSKRVYTTFRKPNEPRPFTVKKIR